LKNKFTYLLAFTILLIYSLTVFRAYMPYLNYQVNYKYISTVLCENKTKPILQCHGKCHLQKELKKTAEQESENNFKITIQLELEDMPARSLELGITKSFFIRSSSYRSLEEKIISPALDHISPPPQAS
jgi:hypothetical protein